MGAAIPVARSGTQALGCRGAVASSHPAISLAGARLLADGANAIDATLAMAATAWSVLPGQSGFGGDTFVIVREPDGRVWTINGSGYGPDGGNQEFYRSRGLSTMPLFGAFSVAVPGTPAALGQLHAQGATRDLSVLWAAAIDALRTGVPCSAKTRLDLREYEVDLLDDPDLSRSYLPGGRIPKLGQLLPQPELVRQVESFTAKPEDFYRGEFAERAVSWLQSRGVPFSGDEWALGADVVVEDAISGSYAGVRIHQTPLPSAGWMVLQQAAICDGLLGAESQLGPSGVRVMVAAALQAFADRVEFAGSQSESWRTSLSPSRVDRVRERIAAGDLFPATPVGVGAGGDTTSTVCVDHEGRAVNLIQSLGLTFGARVSVPGTGVVLNNRLGRGSYLIDDHPNTVQPRRKPLHTLNAWIADDPDRGLLHVGSTPGGDGQVQWNMQLLSHLIDHGDDPQRAVSLPRFRVTPGSDSDAINEDVEVICEAGIPPEAVEALSECGLPVRVVAPQFGGPGGSAMIISADADGVLHAGADPRMEGVALGF